MPPHVAVPGCHLHAFDLSFLPPEPPPAPCATCGAMVYHVLEIELETYADERNLQPQDPELPHLALREVRNSRVSPNWVKDAAVTQLTQQFVELRGPLTCTHESAINDESNITGRDHRIFVDNRPLSPQRSLQVRNHSPSGFAWGYGGPGPSQLALALLLEAGASNQEASNWHQDFKWQHVANKDANAPFEMRGAVVKGYIALQRSRANAERRNRNAA